MRIALVHDYFTQLGGAERVVGELATILEPSMVAASVVDRRLLPPQLAGADIRSTPLQALLGAGAPLASMAPLLPWAFSGLDVGPVDAVVSSSSAFAHQVRAPRGAIHVAYVHTPARFIWQTDDYFREHRGQRRLLAPALAWFRRTDRAAYRRIDLVVANSAHTATRLAQIHDTAPPVVVHPPIDLGSFRPSAERSGRFLVVARLRPYKRLDLAIAAAGRTGLALDVIGSGPDLDRLRRLAGPTVRFLGRRSDADVARAMASCEALIVPGAEDFGMTMAEVQAAGRPPIALGAGGALEIVDDGVSGFLVAEPTVEALAAAMVRAREAQLDVATLCRSAARFDRARFATAIRRLVADAAGGA
ncbi:MAG: glycosyltransferase [Chloroflexi bacterium]|nr:glycosyltransferase [Chloroflexota bacterium]